MFHTFITTTTTTITTTTTRTSNSGQGSPLCPHLNNYTSLFPEYDYFTLAGAPNKLFATHCFEVNIERFSLN